MALHALHCGVRLDLLNVPLLGRSASVLCIQPLEGAVHKCKLFILMFSCHPTCALAFSLAQ